MPVSRAHRGGSPDEHDRAHHLISVRRECRDHILILGEAHVRRILDAYVRYFNHDRPHQGRGQLVPSVPGEAADHTIATGGVRAIPVLGGLHHTYAKAA